MRGVRDLARLLLVSGATGLLLAGCGSAEAPSAPSAQSADGSFTLSSPAFSDGAAIPAHHCRVGMPGGENVSVPLAWSGAPPGTRSFALTMVDRHPIANDWMHWIVVGIPADVTSLAEGASAAGLPRGARELENTFGDVGYGGPQPPAGSGDHTYEITVYALDTDTVDLGDRPSAADIERALADEVLATATIAGTFGR